MNTLDVRVRNMIIAVLAVLCLFLVIQSIAALAKMEKDDGMYPSNVITVRGTGEALGTPDIATFSFTVREENKDVAAAQQAMAEKGNKAKDFLKAQGIEEKDIKTESYYSNPEYNYSNGMMYPSNPVLRGYSVSETVSVKVRDTAKAGEILTGLAALKIGEVGALSFTIDDIDALKMEAKKEAIDKAKAEAENIASALGVDLEGIVSFYEEYPYEGGYGGEMMNASMDKSSGITIAPTFEVGEQKVTANVTITYEIED